MGQAKFSVRMDESLKKQFDALCREFGMNTTTAINVFARAVVRERKIPFEIYSDSITREGALKAFSNLREQAKENDVSDMSIEEINAEIALSRVENDL